jgi:hypothetical protein
MPMQIGLTMTHNMRHKGDSEPSSGPQLAQKTLCIRRAERQIQNHQPLIEGPGYAG